MSNEVVATPSRPDMDGYQKQGSGMQVLLNGLIAGMTMSVMALAFTLVYLPTRVFHVALGATYTIAPFIAWTCLGAGWSWPLAVTLATLTSVLLSLACEWVNHWPLEQKNASPSAHLVSSLGIYILVVQATALKWGNDPKVLRIGLDSVCSFWGMVLTGAQVTQAAGSIIVLACFYAWLGFSNIGLQLRGMADNPVEMALRGYNVRRLRLMAFALAGALGAVSSLTVSFDLGFDPHGGLQALLLAVVAMIIGGRSSFLGPVIAGALLGVIRSEVVWFLSARWQEAVTFLLLALFLLFKPHGILGRKGRVEADS
ncbi:MAG: branched-chain amino acid ABC transporter permease [Thermodesulfobacteriota bacterium]